jgi:short chain dehydrogenase
MSGYWKRYKTNFHRSVIEIRIVETGRFLSQLTHSLIKERLFAKEVRLCKTPPGGNVPQPIDQITDEVWDHLVEQNLSSCMALTRALVPQMKERKWGRVIHITEEARQKFADRTALGRLGDPEELAGPVLLLTSEAGSYITGACPVNSQIICEYRLLRAN